jgi:hypothetical protein
VFALARQFAVDVGIYAAATTTVIGLLASLYKWAWFRTRFIDPIREDSEHRRADRIRHVLEEALPGFLQPILHELRPNGGSSFRDEVNTFMAATKDEQENLRQDNIRLSNMVLSVVTGQAKTEHARLVDKTDSDAAEVRTEIHRAWQREESAGS